MDKFQAPGDSNSVTPPDNPGANAPGSPAAADTITDESQLPAGVWLVRNSLWIVVGALVLVLLYRNFGAEGMWHIAKAALGLSFVIFIHELGHFAVAKWCDVHVETFSIGFGPALPGCRFTYGETTYKLALLPLGGYVKMKGEGTDDEEDDDPRSFKNKTVGQRMAIISAGVIMNVILGCICFVAAYYSGVKQTAGVVGVVEPGSPAWKRDLYSGLVIDQIGSYKEPSFEDLKYEVMLSRQGQQLAMVVHSPYPPATSQREFDIEPRLDKKYDAAPVIGIQLPRELRLLPERYAKRSIDSLLSGPAAAARVVDLKPGDVVTATTDPADPSKQMPLPANYGATDYDELAHRLMALAGEPMTLTIQRAGKDKAETVRIPPVGFQFDDLIVATSAPPADGTTYDPLHVTELKVDPRNPQGDTRDYFEFARRMHDLAGKPVIVQVERKDGELASLLVPSAHYNALGTRMQMDKITAIRDASPAKTAGVQEGDTLKQLVLLDRARKEAVCFTNQRTSDGLFVLLQQMALQPPWAFTSSRLPEELPGPSLQGWKVEMKTLDPLRLPYQASHWAGQHGGNTGPHVTAIITVSRVGTDQGDQHNAQPRPIELREVPWDGARRYDLTLPLSRLSPVALNELGLAYRVGTTVEEVAPNSPAGHAGLKAGDTILEIGAKGEKKELSWLDRLLGRTADDVDWMKLYAEEKGEAQKAAEPMWAHVFFLQLQTRDAKEIKLKVRRPGGKGKEDQEEVLTIKPQPDPAWPADERGLSFALLFDQRLQKASGPLDAIGMGVERTKRIVVNIYMSLASMLNGRVSATKNLHGPIAIAESAYNLAGENWPMFLLFLGMISVNLAVINFLPIPVLDGGHMVFLVYEKLRGKPASEHVRLAATYLGLLFILSLMAFVIYLDVKRRWFGGS